MTEHGGRFHDLTGKTFHYLTVLKEAPKRGSKIQWFCKCKCGTHTTVAACQLMGGKTKSCGCLKIEKTISRSTKHGQARSRTYGIYMAMIARCENPNNKCWSIYGSRGIKLCPKWRASFDNFFRDMGECPKGYSIDRIDANRNYEPSNCRWATAKEQARNKRNNRLLTVRGQSFCISEWAERAGMPREKLRNRLNRGWSPERSIFVT